MTIHMWWIWLGLAVLLVVGEMFTAGFFLLWFGIGAAVAALLDLLGVGYAWQFGSMLVVSGVLLAVSRRFAERFTEKQPPGIGADRFVGAAGVVLEEVDNVENTGRVRIGKDEWRADSDTGAVIPPKTRVTVVRMEGTHLVVRPLEEE